MRFLRAAFSVDRLIGYSMLAVFVALKWSNPFPVEFLKLKVFDYYYGTPRAKVEASLDKGQDVLFDIDWQGTQQLGEHLEADLVRVFILPPSTRELEHRLKKRAQDPTHVVDKRMAKAMDEISHYPEYDYIIINSDLSESVKSVRSILHAERLKRGRQIGLIHFVKQLRDGR